MEITELRVGNYVNKMKQKPELTRVKDISISYQEKYYMLNFCGQKDFYPIELTDDWLFKFGFTLHPWGFVKDNVLIATTTQPSKFWLEVGNGLRAELAFVHELQNLFYCLTKIELTIK